MSTNQTTRYPRNYTSSARTSVALMPTESQLQTYYNQCARKKLSPKDTDSMTRAEIAQEIKRVMDLPLPASEAQLDMLKEMLTQLVDARVPGVKVPAQKFFDSLNIETASKWIEQTRQLQAKFFHLLPATEQQLERIAEMYLCPFIDWESIPCEREQVENVWQFHEDGGERTREKARITVQEESVIHRKVFLEETITLSSGEQTQAWRYMTRMEFMEELKAKLTHTQASYILEHYRDEFYEWQRSRATDGQKQKVRELEHRMASLYMPKIVTQSSEDNPFDLGENDEPFVMSHSKSEWNPIAYVGLTPEQLDMLSREEADAHITMLRFELSDRELRSTTNAQNLSGDFEDMRTAKDESVANTMEFKALSSFLHGLQSALGSHFECDNATTDSLRHDAMQVFFANKQRVKGAVSTFGASEEKKREIKDSIVDYVKLAIEQKAVKFTSLMNLADRSQIANELIEEIISDPEYAVQLLKLQKEQY